MQRFQHDGVEIAFHDQGQGEPIVLVHGFASTADVNWVHPGWVATLTRAGRRVIALDNRGHGASTKLYHPAAYHSAVMAEDVRALLDHLGIVRADVMGYSMGARITAFFAQAHPARLRRAVLGGIGHPPGRLRRNCRRASRKPSKQRRSPMFAIPPAARFAPLPNRPIPISPRWPPAFAGRVKR